MVAKVERHGWASSIVVVTVDDHGYGRIVIFEPREALAPEFPRTIS